MSPPKPNLKPSSPSATPTPGILNTLEPEQAAVSRLPTLVSFTIQQGDSKWHAVALESRGLSLTRTAILDSWSSREQAFVSMEAHSFLYFTRGRTVEW